MAGKRSAYSDLPPYVELATAIIALAARDLLNKRASAEDRRSAAAFLQSDGFRYLADALELSGDTRDRLQRLACLPDSRIIN